MPPSCGRWSICALAHIELAEYEKAVADARLACRHPNTSFWSYLTLASALSNLGRDEEAREARDALMELWPDFSVSRFARMVPFDPAITPRWREGLRKADLDIVDEPGARG
jgi:tetratricopeptide (TPR) repeat protein